VLKYKNALLPYSCCSKPIQPFSPPVAGRLNPGTVENSTHRPTTTLASSVEARPVDSVEPRFTGENGEQPVRTKQGNGDRGGFPAESGFENGQSMLGRNWVRGMDDRFLIGSGFEKAGSLNGFGFPAGPMKPTQVCVGFQRISGQKPTHTGVGFVGSQIRPVCPTPTTGLPARRPLPQSLPSCRRGFVGSQIRAVCPTPTTGLPARRPLPQSLPSCRPSCPKLIASHPWKLRSPAIHGSCVRQPSMEAPSMETSTWI
jgi:hypothetical protein